MKVDIEVLTQLIIFITQFYFIFYRDLCIKIIIFMNKANWSHAISYTSVIYLGAKVYVKKILHTRFYENRKVYCA